MLLPVLLAVLAGFGVGLAVVRKPSADDPLPLLMIRKVVFVIGTTLLIIFAFGWDLYRQATQTSTESRRNRELLNLREDREKCCCCHCCRCCSCCCRVFPCVRRCQGERKKTAKPDLMSTYENSPVTPTKSY